MERKKAIIEILDEQYGIRTCEQLQEAISHLGFIDVSVFCGKLPPEEEKKSND